VFHGVEYQVHSYQDAAKPVSKAGSPAPDKWKTTELLKLAVDRFDEVVGSELISPATYE
jgi:hypothetical protein